VRRKGHGEETDKTKLVSHIAPVTSVCLEQFISVPKYWGQAPSIDGMKQPRHLSNITTIVSVATYLATRWNSGWLIQICITLHPALLPVTLNNDFQGGRFVEGFLGLHGAGHYSVGGDNSDLYSSPNDPNFFLHRLWWIASTGFGKLFTLSRPTISQAL
jgi:hypothetical protein